MPDEQYPPNENLTPETGDASFLTPAEGNAAYVQRSGITKLTVGNTEPVAPATNDVWIDTTA